MKRKILIIDDEISTCTLLSLALRSKYEVDYAIDADSGFKLLKQANFDIVLLDMMIGDDDGIEVLKRIKNHDINIIVIMITAFGSIKTSVEAMKNGAFNYLSKPLDVDELKVHISQALKIRRLFDKVDYLSDELRNYTKYKEIIGNSPAMYIVYDFIEKLKDIDANVMITGESGTGKELVARAIHFSGKRKDERFMVINCAAIPENLLEGELFGYKGGSFTGALQDKKGKFEVANKGSIFLDEIGDMPLSLQSKLLRVLQQKEISPLGSTETKTIDVRIIAATNRDLEKMVEEGIFRQDLYYRLNVMPIEMPPLRERREDIPLLSENFLKQFAQEQNKKIPQLTDKAKELLFTYDYPGNVRQLANILEYAMILSNGGIIDIEEFPKEVFKNFKQNFDNNFHKQLSSMSMKEIERESIVAMLMKYNDRRDLSAAALGISVRSLQNKIKEYEI